MARVALVLVVCCALADDTLGGGDAQLTTEPSVPVPRPRAPDAEQSLNLAESIRKQLMEGNYDYTVLEEGAVGARRSAGPTETPREGPTQPLTMDLEEEEAGPPRVRPHPYLMDEVDGRRHLVPFTFDRDLSAPPPPQNRAQGQPAANETRHKIKYKVIEVPSGNKQRSGRRSGGRSGRRSGRRSARRSGGQETRRFIQEEGEHGVALINLGSGPFPEFRLPAARRQYMQEQDQESEPNLSIDPGPDHRPGDVRTDPGTDPEAGIIAAGADSGIKERYDIYNYYNLP